LFAIYIVVVNIFVLKKDVGIRAFLLWFARPEIVNNQTTKTKKALLPNRNYKAFLFVDF